MHVHTHAHECTPTAHHTNTRTRAQRSAAQRARQTIAAAAHLLCRSKQASKRNRTLMMSHCTSSCNTRSACTAAHTCRHTTQQHRRRQHTAHTKRRRSVVALISEQCSSTLRLDEKQCACTAAAPTHGSREPTELARPCRVWETPLWLRGACASMKLPTSAPGPPHICARTSPHLRHDRS